MKQNITKCNKSWGYTNDKTLIARMIFEINTVYCMPIFSFTLIFFYLLVDIPIIRTKYFN